MMEFRKGSCDQFRPWLHLRVEGELDPIRSARLGPHLAACKPCRDELAKLEQERTWILGHALESPVLPERFGTRIVETLAAERRRRRSWRLVGNSLGTAAALLIVGLIVASVDRGPAPVPEPGALSSSSLPSSSLPMVSSRRDFPTASHRGSELSDVCTPESTIDRAYCPPIDVTAVADEMPPPRYRVVARGLRSSHAAVRPVFNARSATVSGGGIAALFGLVDRVYLPAVSGQRRALDTQEDDPCRPDLNADGKTDIIDVAFYCHVMWSSDLPETFSSHRSAETVDDDCGEPCT